MSLFPVLKVDTDYYEEKIRDFLPEKIIDIHTHVYKKLESKIEKKGEKRCVTWPSLVAKDNSVSALILSYKMMFPGKNVTPLIFCTTEPKDRLDEMNNYIQKAAKDNGFPALHFARPEQSSEELKGKLISGGFSGIKVYLNYSPSYIPAGEIRIFDFLPHKQLELLDEMGLIVMLHIPRPGRLKDPVNIAQILEIEEKYPNLQLIIAHVGRAYCSGDVGNSLNILSKTKNLVVDFSANTNQWVFARTIEALGPERILFGSDMPITRMRMRRIEENGIYKNIVPEGLYGDVSDDKNMKEVSGNEADKLSFFMYEEINAFRLAAEEAGLNRKNIEDIFYNNARKILEKCGFVFPHEVNG